MPLKCIPKSHPLFQEFRLWQWLQNLRIYEKVNIAEALSNYQGLTVATGLDNARGLYEMDLRQAIAWLFGSEGQGLSADTMALAQQKVMIPMASGVESLNVAAAAAVCLFEERRQKLAV